jgi:hypothetical protein
VRNLWIKIWKLLLGNKKYIKKLKNKCKSSAAVIVIKVRRFEWFVHVVRKDGVRAVKKLSKANQEEGEQMEGLD